MSDEPPVPPRAPSQAAWDAMSEDERRAVVEALPAFIPWEELRPPEGDLHMEAKTDALGTLRTFFASTGRRVYVSSELGVYYPDEPRFAPDLLAVCDVDPHRREKWVVSAENKGLDFVVEVHVKGSSKKDLEKNVERYARLGIPEYFIYDRRRQQLRGFRLPTPDARTYQPIEPVAGKLPARTLGLDLVLEGGRLRFYAGNACLLDTSELVDRLGNLVAEIESNADARIREIEERAAAEAERATAEAERATAEAERATAEAERATAEAERATAEAERATAEAERAAALEARLAEYERRFGPLR